MKNDNPSKPEGMPRRDFLAHLSLVSAGIAAGGLQSLIPIGANQPSMIAPPGTPIAKLAIYPTIGISRVGNSKAFFLAPEIPGRPPQPDGGFKDGSMKIKKQAQRFRIYGFDEKGRVVREITEEKDNITWTVKVANTKAAWYEFNNPLDMGKYAPGLPGKLRNNFFVGKEREVLEIAPEATSISGRSTNSKGNEKAYIMADDFWRAPNTLKVKLGHLQTDEKGRLIVVPGDGVGESAIPQTPIDNFADNDGWHDDWADGYVKAEVRLNGLKSDIPVEPAWIASCGPNYAPEIEPFITLYDVLKDVMVYGKKGDPFKLRPADKLSFRADIYPFFKRLGLMEWITAASNFRQGWIEIGDFLDPAYVKKLADPSPANKAFREEVFSNFRSPAEYKLYDNDTAYSENIQYKIPYMLGSGVNYSFSPAHWFAMPQLQYDMLTAWKDGHFTNDLKQRNKADETGKFEDLPLDQQPHALIRAALEPCSGGAFHPGVELTWPMRQQAIYRDDEPFRIKVGKRGPVWHQTNKLGLLLTPEVAFEGAKRAPYPSGESYSYYDLPEDSPIGPQNPGDLSRWLGLPWHPDAFSCQQVMYSNDFPNAAWWPALLPIDVLPEYCYQQLSRPDLSDEEKLKFYNDRQLWTRGVTGIGYHVQGSYDDGLERMVALWTHMGFVTARPRPGGLSPELKKLIPEVVYVEAERGSMDLYTEDPPNQGLPPKKHK